MEHLRLVGNAVIYRENISQSREYGKTIWDLIARVKQMGK